MHRSSPMEHNKNNRIYIWTCRYKPNWTSAQCICKWKRLVIHKYFFLSPSIITICPRTFSNRVWRSLLMACRAYIQWYISYLSALTLVGCGSSCMTFLDYSQRRTAVGRTPLDEWPARRRDLYLTTTHNAHNRQTSMPSVGFEPTILAGERP